MASLIEPWDGIAIWRDRVRHEAGKAVGAVMLDFSFDVVAMDRWADDDDVWGSVGGLRRISTRAALGDVPSSTRSNARTTSTA